MAEYQIVYEGKLTGERPLADVKRNLAALFKMPAEQVETLFSGKPVIVKRGIDQATAAKYQAAFKKAGAVCLLINENSASPATATPPRQEASSTQNFAGSANRNDRGGRMAGKDIVNIPIPQDLSGLSMGNPGEILETLPNNERVNIPDTTGLSFTTDDAVYLAPAKEIAPPKLDTSGLSLETSE